MLGAGQTNCGRVCRRDRRVQMVGRHDDDSLDAVGPGRLGARHLAIVGIAALGLKPDVGSVASVFVLFDKRQSRPAKLLKRSRVFVISWLPFTSEQSL